ncbi:MAG: NADH-quinone oxidoreductase subunit C [Phycisphaeraceae bacterium]|nr:NADH-quinone oxidoreductase subunit C [Phycisphaeraceae bacterium]
MGGRAATIQIRAGLPAEPLTPGEYRMTPAQIVQHLRTVLGQAVTDALVDPGQKHPRLHTTAEHWRALAERLANDPLLAFDWLSCLTAVDYAADQKLAAAYDLRSTRHGHEIAVKVYLDRDKPELPTVMDLWPAADWHEREAYDLMGIRFTGHTDLRRILLPEDWIGHPLRKDYVFPRQYQGIPATYELDWQQQANYPG